ncbi:DUF4197 domain-containing protein [Sphingomonas sp. MS122]|uniref:DUF4197 domain-containing protein n=1 Tax=Sphingomonas sp. MS122 TaxID=3412683 RepID=UPI003C2D83D0
MIEPMNRRSLLAGMAMLPLVAVAGCMAGPGSYTVEEGVRRLLTLSSQRAFDRLIRPGGFYDDQLTRLSMPERPDDRSGAVLAAVLRTNAVRSRIAIALNDLAVDAADRATPVVLDAIRRMTFADALAVLRGGPTAATDLLARETEGAVIDAMYPDFADGLRGDAFEILTAAVAAASGFDLGALARDVSRQAGRAIFLAIGREEAEIRRNPRATRDPVLIALLGG